MHRQYKHSLFRQARRLVVKLGSSIVATESGVHRERVGRIVAEISRLHEDGYEIVVVTSGARAAGLARLGLKRMPTRIPEQQAAAAIGQIGLMSLYEEFFADHGKHVGQVLLTATGLRDRSQYINAKRTLNHLLENRIVPIVNENDSVAIDELKFGDNDRLSALVAGLAEADLLIMLTDVDGVYSGDPQTQGSKLVEVIKGPGLDLAGGGQSGRLGSGGMRSKLLAARSAGHRGIPVVVANGLEAGTLGRILSADDSVGTLFLPSDSPISNRKYWIAYGVPVQGRLLLDEGAVKAICERGASLLPAGVTAAHGDFRAGACVACESADGVEVARGLVSYDAGDCRALLGKSSSAIESELGYYICDELIHRDDLVLLRDVEEQSGGNSERGGRK